jgi:small conductance mechanosensitive channel
MVGIMTIQARTRSAIGALALGLSLLLSLGSPAPASAANPQPIAGLAQSTPEGSAAGENPEVGEKNEKGIGDRMDSLFERLRNEPDVVLKEWALEDGPRLIGNLLLFFLILFVSKVIGRWLARLTRGGLERSKLNASELFKNFVENTVTKVIFFVGLIVALQTIGLNVAPLLAGVGVMGFVVGFALQDTLGNFAAGVMLLLYRPYDIGDVVTVTGETGSVEAMTLVSTTLLTPDNQRLTIPNGSIWGSTIRNITANETRRIDQTFGIAYDDDIEKAEAVMLDVVNSMEHVKSDPAAQVMLMELADSSVNFNVRAWVPTSQYFGTVCELRRQMKLRFDKEGISFPFPQQDVHMHQVDPSGA